MGYGAQDTGLQGSALFCVFSSSGNVQAQKAFWHSPH